MVAILVRLWARPATWHHEESKRGIEKDLDHRAITTFDRYPLHAGGTEHRTISFSPTPSWANANRSIPPAVVAEHTRHIGLRRPSQVPVAAGLSVLSRYTP